MTDESPQKKCFVIGPIGKAGSDTRNKADYLLEYIIKPAAEKHGYKAFRADEVSDPGLISEQVISYTLDSDLVIADLTSHNPNAFYELGIRHTGSKKPTIHMILEGEIPPFDVKDHRYITYKLDNPKDLEDAVESLSKAISSLGSNPEVHNPVTRARGLDLISSGEDSTDQILNGLVEKTNRLERELNYLRPSKDKVDVPRYIYLPINDLSENPQAIGKMIAKRYTEIIEQDADKEKLRVILHNQDKEEDE
ncbi:MAG: hypothetical protein N0C81_19935 [Candidatus Thiodiazotropha lotti]|uniref:Nucleoside 2-deoxyribosyltransferase n=1 Tax=Candidatus Thiodiazotropha lotti TaxID=2792787 RepID=A0A9E4K4G2_9GAMM|nr:hypothetical protein [Candidatus Thiodiazotropha lotti]ODB99733.1 hypothetical protein A3197_12515 [Candidatus Thiodiazotropha endoloripes]MCG7921495.1 hypothetical protein [Candidatus Thiodiazotropha lotti]MCG7932412.1 hypothetical protein [Candidatus Thiodiazotropha lotti]MCG7939507.1 hypothetical protein [Candidatus Thiodiazotropha lotti]